VDYRSSMESLRQDPCYVVDRYPRYCSTLVYILIHNIIRGLGCLVATNTTAVCNKVFGSGLSRCSSVPGYIDHRYRTKCSI
jgi:hypothetical protein